MRQHCSWRGGTVDLQCETDSAQLGKLICVYCRCEKERYSRIPPYCSPTYATMQRNPSHEEGKDCRWCGKKKEEWTDKRKKFYCSEECSVEFNHYHYFNFTWVGIRESVWERDGKKCAKCSKELSLETAKIDHILAVINGGGDEKENLQTLCDECHNKKTGLDIRQKNRAKFLENQTTLVSAFEHKGSQKNA